MKMWTTMEEAEALSNRFKGIKKAQFSRQYKLPGGASMLSQHLSGHRPISLEAAKVYAMAFNCSLEDISPRLAKEVNDASELIVQSPIAEYQSNGLEIPLLSAKGSMGNGNENDDADIVIDVLRVTKQWVNKTLPNVSKLSNLRFIHAMGDSMLPTFNDGDILLVDAGAGGVSVDGVYVLDAHNRLFIKRVRRKMDGTYEISSDNPSVKTVDVLNGEHEIAIKGRVVWVWNGRRV